MEVETDGGAQEQAQDDETGMQDTQAQTSEVASAPDYETAIAERDTHIAELEAQVAAAAKSAEATEELKTKIAELKQQGADERTDFALQLAGCRNVKAARAILEDHGDDIEKLKAAEPWLFAKHIASGEGGATGLPNAAAASDEGKQMKHWREIAGLADESNKQ